MSKQLQPNGLERKQIGRLASHLQRAPAHRSAFQRSGCPARHLTMENLLSGVANQQFDLRYILHYCRGVMLLVLQPTEPAVDAAVAVPPKLKRMIPVWSEQNARVPVVPADVGTPLMQ